ncbi:hypothetical protein D3C77_450700 [compost metagenome]
MLDFNDPDSGEVGLFWVRFRVSNGNDLLGKSRVDPGEAIHERLPLCCGGLRNESRQLAGKFAVHGRRFSDGRF